MSACILAEVGKSYLVPCIYVAPKQRYGGWAAFMPVIGPRHSDAEHLNFPYEHFHIDWRFVSDRAFQSACDMRTGKPHGLVITNTHGERKLDGAPVLRRRVCKRPMPDFPRQPGVQTRSAVFVALEEAHASTCSRLKPGNICPHRGIDLTPFIQADGTAICPGHGLKWNTTTGELMRHHRLEAA